MFRLCLYIVLISALGIQGQLEGQSCVKDGVTGECKLIWQCQKAIEELTKYKRNPQICSFIKTDPVVCCVSSSAAPTSAPVTTKPTPPPTERPVATTVPNRISTTTEYTPEANDYVNVDDIVDECPPILPNMTAPRTGQKAWDKCIEYQEQLVYPCEKSKALVDTGKVRGSNCKHSTNQLIVGGEDATEAEFPHMALLGFGEQTPVTFPCGGSVISDRFILTAGHCISTKELGPVAYALVGTLKRSADYDRKNLYNIGRIIKHPDYKPPQKYNDIALLQTDRRIQLSLFVVPACLDTGRQGAEEALASGWGATANRGSNADVLQKVKLAKFPNEECSSLFPATRLMKQGFDTRTQICYGDKKVSKDTCQGDSGGPLQIKSTPINCMYVIVGVTSFGRACGFVGQPGIYTRVAEYVEWIENEVWP